MNEPYISFQIPDVPFSQVRVPYAEVPDDRAALIVAAILDAVLVRETFLRAFAEAHQVSEPEPSTTPAQQTRSRPAQRPQGSNGAADDRVRDEELFCPDCHQQLSYYDNDQYAKWEEGDDGLLYAQSFACTSPRCVQRGKKTKAVWRSKALWRDQVSR